MPLICFFKLTVKNPIHFHEVSYQTFFRNESVFFSRRKFLIFWTKIMTPFFPKKFLRNSWKFEKKYVSHFIFKLIVKKTHSLIQISTYTGRNAKKAFSGRPCFFFHLGIFGWQHHTKLFNLHFKNFGKWYSWKKESDHFKYAEKSFFDFLIKNWESLSFQKFGWNSWKFKKKNASYFICSN